MKRIRDYGITIGRLPTGLRNSITDVPGVTVGHVTLSNGPIQTGVTAILPHSGNWFKEKVLASSHVINGFGKTMGTIQMEELGTMETPIILTNTLSIGTASEALIEYMLEENRDIGLSTGTVNPVVCECNDGYLNDIRGMHVTKEHVWQAIRNAQETVVEGAVGAGTGMSCFGLKGGIGTASRIVAIDAKDYTIGVLVLSNFGLKEDFVLNGYPVGKWIRDWEEKSSVASIRERGSIIFIVATDLPLTERQLHRMCKRTSIGLIRTGSYMGNGSGDIAIGFSTAGRVPHECHSSILSINMLHEENIDLVFRAVGEATEEAILNSMVTASSITGRDGHTRKSLHEYMDRILNHAKKNLLA